MAIRLEDTAFLFGANGIFVEDLYGRYLRDPHSVDSSWRRVFAEIGDDAQTVTNEVRGATWAPREAPARVDGEDDDRERRGGGGARAPRRQRTATRARRRRRPATASA